MSQVKRPAIYAALLVACMLHLTLRDLLALGPARPDFMLIVIIFFSLRLGPRVGFEVGFVAGILTDAAALDFVGINTFIDALTGYLSGALYRRFFRESSAASVLTVFGAVIFAGWCHYTIVGLLSRIAGFGWWEYCCWVLLPSGLYTALLAIPAFLKLSDLYGLRQSEEYL